MRQKPNTTTIILDIELGVSNKLKLAKISHDMNKLMEQCPQEEIKALVIITN
jgi:hypothetical protein